MQELYSIVCGVGDYLGKAWNKVQPFAAGIVTLVNYLIFPENAYKSAAIALSVAVFIDIITKYYYYSKMNNGLKNAIREHYIRSECLWMGAKRKIISYLVVMILCGLSIRVTMLVQVTVFISTFAYSMMFLRECQSILENLIDAGHTELDWFLIFIRKKQEAVFKDTIEQQNSISTDIKLPDDNHPTI